MQLLSGILVLVLAVLTLAEKPHYNVDKAPELFEKFVKDYNRHYANDIDKEEHYNAFVASLVAINNLNKESTSAVFDINNMADLTPKELQLTHGFRPFKLKKLA